MTTTYAQSADGFRCDECGQAMAVPLFCDHCGTDYPERRRMSAFAVLGLPAQFDLDGDELDRRELALGKRLHPDAWQGRGDRLAKRALLAQSAVNEALKAVRDPFDRARALLELAGDGDGKSVMPPAFLMEHFELQEEIEDGVDGARKRELTKRARTELRALREELASAFAGGGDAEAVRRAVDASNYWRNVQRALRGDGPAAR